MSLTKPSSVQSFPTPPASTTARDRPPAKSVHFTWTEKGGWACQAEIGDPKFFFTERDWNQISILLNVKRAHLRRQAALAYHAANRPKEQVISEPKKV